MSSLVCKSCSNGCVLAIVPGENETVVSGGFCPRGAAFAYRRFRDEYRAPFKSKLETVTGEICSELLKLWGVELLRLERGIPIQGSPERSLFRSVAATVSHGRFILEEIAPERVERRNVVSRYISSFGRDIPVVPYSVGLDGEVIQKYDGRFWMLHPYIEHIAIDRGTFWEETWRGEAVGKIVSVLQQQKVEGEELFSVEAYVNAVVLDIKRENPEHYTSFSAIFTFLERELFPRLSSLPAAFCHGDAHPLNMLWSNDSITALIDWEFCGNKPRIYDLALIIGCVGSEDPSALDGGFNRGLITTVRGAGVITAEEWQVLPALVIALRFNWLSEWLRRNDEEMVSFELFYMNHLLNSYYPEYSEDA